MKKSIFLLIGAMSLMGNVYAQNSTVEANNVQETAVETFINSCSFIKTETLLKYSDNGLEIYPKVFTNLQTNQKIGGVQFFTESKRAAAAFKAMAVSLASNGNAVSTDDGAPKPLGYLDLSEVDDFVMALENIVSSSKNKAEYKYTISYCTAGGIDILFDSEEEGVQFRKKWYAVNAFGVREAFYMSSEWISLKSVTKIISTIKDIKSRIETMVNAQ